MIQSDPSGKHVLHVDLALDKIYVWDFDEDSGQFQPNATRLGVAAAR